MRRRPSTRRANPCQGLAAVAKQEGSYVGALIRRRLAGDMSAIGFRYRDYGTMATIGRSAAVADLRGFRLTGSFAWLLWGVVHIYLPDRLSQSACGVGELVLGVAHPRPGRGLRLITGGAESDD